MFDIKVAPPCAVNCCNPPAPAANVVRMIWAVVAALTAGAGRMETWLGAAGRMILCNVEVPACREVT